MHVSVGEGGCILVRGCVFVCVYVCVCQREVLPPCVNNESETEERRPGLSVSSEPFTFLLLSILFEFVK